MLAFSLSTVAATLVCLNPTDDLLARVSAERAKADVAALVASQPLAFWAHKFEAADAARQFLAEHAHPLV